MKRCPTCSRTFEESLTFCLVDGAVLSAPFDYQETEKSRKNKPSRTEILPGNVSLSPTVPAPHSAPYAPQISQSAVSAAQPAKPGLWKRLVRRGLIGFLIGVVAALLVNTRAELRAPDTMGIIIGVTLGVVLLPSILSFIKYVFRN